MSLKGDVSKIRRLQKVLKSEVPTVVAQKIASRVSPALTRAARSTFDAGQNPYGDAWPLGANGERLTLKKTQALFNAIRFAAVGRITRLVVGGQRHFRFHFSKVLPAPSATVPKAWQDEINEAAKVEIDAAIGGAK